MIEVVKSPLPPLPPPIKDDYEKTRNYLILKLESTTVIWIRSKIETTIFLIRPNGILPTNVYKILLTCFWNWLHRFFNSWNLMNNREIVLLAKIAEDIFVSTNLEHHLNYLRTRKFVSFSVNKYFICNY